MSTPTPAVRTEVDAAGRLVRAWVPSRSQTGVVYEMVRYSGGWTHTDTKCRGWVDGDGRCYHVTALEGVTEMNETAEETRAITVQMSPLALMDDIDLQEIMTSKLAAVPEWMYSFNVKGQIVEGVSARGVQDAVRALSAQGEAIRVIDVRLERETDTEAYFMAVAARFAISPDGREIETDRVFRGKRQPKLIQTRDRGAIPNEFWYEIGITKASRNAIDALLPTALRNYLKDQARALAKGGTPEQRREAQHRTAPAKKSGAEQKHPKMVALDLHKQARDRADWPAIAEELHAAFPTIADDNGTVVFTGATDAQVGEVVEFLTTRLTVQAELV